MRIALVSDSHIRSGRPTLPARLLDALRTADLVLHAGDIADESGLEAFQAIGPPVVAVAGNLDTRPLAARLPQRRLVETPAGTIALTHVLPRSRDGAEGTLKAMLGDCLRPLAVVYGHTHRPEVVEVHLPDGGKAWVVNPGSVTRDRGWGHTFALLDCLDGRTQLSIQALD